MKTLFRHLAEPLNIIKEQPYQFTVWWLVAIGFGLAGFWLPILINAVMGELNCQMVLISIQAGSLASFSVVILADGIASMLVAVRAGSNITAAGLRGLVSIIAFLLAVIHVAFLSAHPKSATTSYAVFQSFITILAILLASYLYCFRSPSWEKGVAQVKEEEDQEVRELGKEAESKSADDTGVKL